VHVLISIVLVLGFQPRSDFGITERDACSAGADRLSAALDL
jgi:hypothetical protein